MHKKAFQYLVLAFFCSVGVFYCTLLVVENATGRPVRISFPGLNDNAYAVEYSSSKHR